jgi:hypothetical protein
LETRFVPAGVGLTPEQIRDLLQRFDTLNDAALLVLESPGPYRDELTRKGAFIKDNYAGYRRYAWL